MAPHILARVLRRQTPSVDLAERRDYVRAINALCALPEDAVLMEIKLVSIQGNMVAELVWHHTSFESEPIVHQHVVEPSIPKHWDYIR